MKRTIQPKSKSERRSAGRHGTKVKSGCRTCKNRKVECDEGRPACARCTNAGHVCPGYGVWGGADISRAGSSGRDFSRSSRSELDTISDGAVVIPRLLWAGPLSELSGPESALFDWFRYYVSVKLSGAFNMSFWNELVMRASAEEPAVLHAALALSAIHKRLLWPTTSVAATGEEFMLRHYNRAIRHLTSSQASTRVVLVTCMLFACLELMRGRYQTGNNHLRSGIRLLSGLYGDSYDKSHELSGLTAGAGQSLVPGRRPPLREMDASDQWLAEAFTRMNLLAAQFSIGAAGPRRPILPPYLFHLSSPERRLPSLPITFSSIHDARRSLDQLLGLVFSLTDRCRRYQQQQKQQQQNGLGLEPPRVPMEDAQTQAQEQEKIQASLRAWIHTYRISRVGLYGQLDLLSRVAYHQLPLYHDMAAILAATCLDVDDELAFDAHGYLFQSIIRNALLFWRAVQAVHNTPNSVYRQNQDSHAPDEADGEGLTTAIFNADFGWMPPLYFTALHCRLLRVRKQAIRFIRVVPCREGMWDSVLSAAVAEHVWRLEEGDRGLAEPTTEEPFLDEELFGQDGNCVMQPLSPSCPRVHNVQLVLPNDSSGVTMLVCERRGDKVHEMIREAYDPLTGRWSPLQGK